MKKILKIFKNVFYNPSNRNILTMLIGTSAAQAIPVVASIILTRIYTPEEYGLLAIFVSIVAMIGPIVTLRYELAILVPSKEQDAVNVTIVSILNSIFLSFLLFILLLLLKNPILNLFNIQALGNWIFMVPVSTMFMGIYSSLNFLATRVGVFKVISKTRVYQAASGALSQICLGLMQFGAGGLIIGSSLSHLVGNLKLIKKIFDNYHNEYKNFKIKEAQKLANRYIDYPKYSVPSTLFNNASIHVMSFVIPTFYSASILGFYSLSQRIIILPMKVISSSISQVFLNEASLEMKQHNTSKYTFISTFKKLILIALPLYVILFLFVEELITFVYGDTWERAGEISRILVILLFFRFIVNPLSNVLNLYEKQKVILLWQVSLVILTIMSTLIAYIYSFNFNDFLLIYVVSLSVDYILMFFICLYFSQRKVKE